MLLSLTRRNSFYHLSGPFAVFDLPFSHTKNYSRCTRGKVRFVSHHQNIALFVHVCPPRLPPDVYLIVFAHCRFRFRLSTRRTSRKLSNATRIRSRRKHQKKKIVKIIFHRCLVQVVVRSCTSHLAAATTPALRRSRPQATHKKQTGAQEMVQLQPDSHRNQHFFSPFSPRSQC